MTLIENCKFLSFSQSQQTISSILLLSLLHCLRNFSFYFILLKNSKKPFCNFGEWNITKQTPSKSFVYVRDKTHKPCFFYGVRDLSLMFRTCSCSLWVKYLSALVYKSSQRLRIFVVNLFFFLNAKHALLFLRKCYLNHRIDKFND